MVQLSDIADVDRRTRLTRRALGFYEARGLPKPHGLIHLPLRCC